MNDAGTIALIIGVFIFICVLFSILCGRSFSIDSNAENERGPEEPVIETVVRSAPVVIIEATVDQAEIVNDAFDSEFNEESPPAYEDLFVKTEKWIILLPRK